MNRPDPLLASCDSPLIARETAETLARRCTLGLFAYPTAAVAAIVMAPGKNPRLWVDVSCVLAQFLAVGLRLLAMLPFDRRYAPNPARWRRDFRVGVYGSALLWVVFALHLLTANVAAWPTWMR